MTTDDTNNSSSAGSGDGVGNSDNQKPSGSESGEAGSQTSGNENNSDDNSGASSGSDANKAGDQVVTPEEHEAVKAQLAEREAELELLKREKLSDNERAVKDAQDAVRNELSPKVDSLTKAVEGFLADEINTIPEDKRELIPNLGLEEKLAWVRNAKAKGLFNTAPSSSSGIIPGTTPSGSGAGQKPAAGTPEYQAYLQQKYGVVAKRSTDW